MEIMTYSIIIPVFKNEASIPRLLITLNNLQKKLKNKLEVIFVVDGSPDRSFLLLNKAIISMDYSAQLIAHSRNFGSFAAIRTGLIAARGKYFAVMAADLQEPPDLILDSFYFLSQNQCDVVVGTRINRQDNIFSKISSNIFWSVYKKFVIQDMPKGGVDIFVCNSLFREHLLQLEESRSSLIGLIFWLGFRRKEIPYTRQKRLEGKSTWTMNKKIDYMMDSIFSFTDYPIRLLIKVGFFGSFSLIFLILIQFFYSLNGKILVPGYSSTVILIALIGAINLLALGLVGTYAWRAYDNTKKRPLSVVASIIKNKK
jgi:glycosyltransferase involved in cell wall biosynthesis